MKQIPQLQKIIIPIVAIVIGLSIGLGVGHQQLKKEQKIFQDKIKESGKKMAFIQKKMAEEKDEATASLGQKCQSDTDKLQNEKKALSGQLAKLKEKKKDLQEAGKKYDQAIQQNKDLEHNLKKVNGEKDNLQAQLKKTAKALKSCK